MTTEPTELTADQLAQLLPAAQSTPVAEPTPETAIAQAPPSSKIRVQNIDDLDLDEVQSMQLFNKLYDQFKDTDAVSQARKYARLQEIKRTPGLEEIASKYLLEISGANPFSHTIRVNPVVEFEFQTFSGKILEEVFRQDARDVSLQRTMLGRADSSIIYYRAAMSLVSYRIYNPASSVVVRAGSPMSTDPDVLEFVSDELHQYDMGCRRFYLFLRDKLFANGSLFQLFMQAHNQFEGLMDDMTFLLQEEPDFFSTAS